MLVVITLLITTAACCTIAYWLHRNSIVRKCARFREYKRHIDALPGPRSYPLIGTTYMFLSAKRADIPRVMQKQFDEFPDISRTWLGPFQAHIHLTKAEHMEIVLGSSTRHNHKSWSYEFLWPWLGQGLLTSGGERWRKHRKIITPTFHFEILESFCEIFAENSRKLLARIELYAKGEQVVDVYPLIGKLTLDIIAEAAMGCKVDAQDDKNNEYVSSISMMGELLLQRLIRPWFYSNRIYAMSQSGQATAATMRKLHEFSTSVIRDRKRILQTNVDNSTTSASHQPKKRRLAFLDLLLTGSAVLDDVSIREEVDTFMFEGHDTTTSGLAWTILLLGLHPDIQERTYEECREVYTDRGNDSLTIADLNRMQQLERVLKESMRLYPPVPNISRRLSESVTLDGYTIPKDTTAILELVHLHQDERFFPNHKEFDPDRFTAENSKERHPFAYLPFSAGARNCIGQKFAMYEEKTVISQLLMRFKWKAACESRFDVEYVYELITRPISGIPILFELRS